MSSSQLRPLREDDADAVAALFVEAWGEARRMNGDEIREWFNNQALSPENLLVLEHEGRVVGYFDVWIEDDVADVDVAAPGFWDEVFDHAENRARALGAKRVRSFVVEEHPVGDLVTGRGYRTIRGSWTMEIEFGVEVPAEPVLPDGIEIRRYHHPEDEQRVYEATQEAFLDHWDFHPVTIENWREFNVKTRNFEPDLWLVAWDGDQVAGASLNYPERGGDPGHGWVGTLGVRREWRRRGLGEALLRRSFAALHARGLRKVRLGVDAENPTGATRLYERAGMHVVRRSNTWERHL
ncbi:MAG: mycothiol synthase [Gaiellaceae bacterium]|nr:mycothiol synthase [Gaiellaceae bacterium]